jgi:glycosyltransferase involved in cell wall biosynthesis
VRFSVVVPVHNGGADLRACLQAIAASSRKADEVIVVDDCSSDGAAGCAIEFSAQVVRVSVGPCGPAFARNQGARQASGDVIVFVDADVQVHADALDQFEHAFRDDAALAAAFGSYDDEPSAPGRVSRFKNLLHHYVHQHGTREAETFWAGCGAVRREVFASLGGFSEDYRRPSIEDIEFGARLREAGHRVQLRPEILCTHRKQWTFLSLLRTDIFARAIPWTRLILRQGRLPSGLNTDGKSRWSAVLAWLLVLGAILCPVSAAFGFRWFALAVAGFGFATVAALCAINRRLYRFFFGHGGLGFGVSATALHVLYLLYSSAVFAGMIAFSRITGGSDARSAGTPRR